MSLTTSLEIQQTWGSHQPLLKAVMTILRPRSAVECGSGNFSTPFLQAVPYLHTIEHDEVWAKKVRSAYPPPLHHKWTVQRFKARNSTRIPELPEGEYIRILKWYIELASKEPPFDFLFMDTFLSCRVPATLAFAEKAQMVLVHDMEPQSRKVYEWNRLDHIFRDWYCYIHKPLGFIATQHPIPWTGLFSRKPLDVKRLDAFVRSNSIALWNQDVGLEKE